MAAGSYGKTLELPDAHSTVERIAGSPLLLAQLALTLTLALALNAGAER